MWDDFLGSERGQRIVNTHRWLRRLYLDVKGIEPRSKAAMPKADQEAFRKAVGEELTMRRRKAFRGPVVMRLRFETTDKTPGHIHTISKNIIDLLGKGADTASRSNGLLYRDDAQVCGLVVSCRHGANHPWIGICARSLYDFRQDLAVALDAKETVTPRREPYPRRFTGLSLRAQDQGDILSLHRMRVSDLAYFYRASDFRFRGMRDLHDQLADQWEAKFRQEPFRILVSEPPQEPGASMSFKNEVRGAVEGFRERFSRMLTPLLVPVALEVVVKPPPPTRLKAVHDLDNLLRKYLIPSVIDILQPPANSLWALEREEELRRNGFGFGLSEMISKMPRSSAVGLVRMEAWRIMRSPADLSPGFVSIAIVADQIGLDDSISVVDHVVDEYTERLSD